MRAVINIETPVRCHNGHTATWRMRISGYDVQQIGVSDSESCKCPKHDYGQGWFVAGDARVVLPPSTLNRKRLDYALELARKADTVTLLTCEEVSDLVRRAYAGEFDSDIFNEGVSVLQKFRKKPVVIEAVRWFKNGDHPQDYDKDSEGFEGGELRTFTGAERKERGWEGGIVRYFRRPDVSGDKACQHCGGTMHIHGWIDTKEGGHIVCPGDWIITGVAGEMYPVKPEIFEATYEAVAE